MLSWWPCFQIMFILDDPWVVEAPDRLCKNSVLGGYVDNQLECQNLCTDSEECVGISYSQKVTTACYVCRDDILSDASLGYGFYRTPGKIPVSRYNHVYKYFKKYSNNYTSTTIKHIESPTSVFWRTGPPCPISCLNGGRCINDTRGVGSCSCEAGYSGSRCEEGNKGKYFQLMPQPHIISYQNNILYMLYLFRTHLYNTQIGLYKKVCVLTKIRQSVLRLDICFH